MSSDETDILMEGAYRNLLAECECCPRACGVDRYEGEGGFCRTGARVRVSRACLHHGEEPPISGTRGSGTIFFMGCNLRCAFCQNHQISQEWTGRPGRALGTDELASEMLRLQAEGAHNINLVSPSHVAFQVAEGIEAAIAAGLEIPVVYNSNGYDSVSTLRRIRGLVSIYLPDIKYMDNGLGARLSAVDDYADVIGPVLEEMLDQVGPLKTDGEGVATRGLLVRHLVLPGQMENSRRCLKLLSELDRSLPVSLMSQYSPQHIARHHPGIDRPLAVEEYEEITAFALDCGLENAFVQEMASRAHYLPDFDRERPFESGAPAERRAGSRACRG
jgi:putative pyruvate formate lyase activating enzyme